MNIKLFWEKINLPQKVIEETEKIEKNFIEISNLCQLYEIDHEKFYEKVLEKERSELFFLYLYSFMACKTYDKYQEKGISEKIFLDTFVDIRYWCENYEREYGRPGLGAHDWFYRHIDMKLFRLGRLQFEEMYLKESFEGGERLQEGDMVLNVHVPQGESISWNECEESFRQAKKFWGKEYTFICHSWLLYPGLKDLLGENSNIRRFAGHFRILETDYREREAEWRIFGKVERIIENYPEDTLLQRRAKAYLLSGKALGNSWGIFKG